MQFSIFWLVLLICLPLPHARAQAHELSKIYPQPWVVELLHHPLRVSLFQAQAQGTIQHSQHHFSNRPHSVTNQQTKHLSQLITTPSSYQRQTSIKTPHIIAIAMLRFENEQQTIDFIIDQNFKQYLCYINDEFQAHSSSPNYLFHPSTSKKLHQLFVEFLPKTKPANGTAP